MQLLESLKSLNNITGYANMVKEPLTGVNCVENFLHMYGAIIMFAVFFVSCIPLLGDSLIKADDTIIHLVRLEGLKDGYIAGQLPVKVEPTINGGYGYAFSTYYGSLFYNIPAIFRLMGFTMQDAYKLFVVIVNLK